MCEVCAVFGIGTHWTDAAARADARLPAPDIARYRGERQRRIALVNALVTATGIEVTDWDGESFWVADRNGRGARAPDLNAVWRLAERLSGARFDPLDRAFANVS